MLPRYFAELIKFYKLLKRSNNLWTLELNPILTDYKDSAGNTRSMYFKQDLFVAQEILKNKYNNLLDIGSRFDGLIAHLASFRTIDVIDIRHMNETIKNINFIQLDITNVKKSFFNSWDAISSTFCIGHIGLGRYSDRLDVNGHLTAFDNMFKMLKSKGDLHISVPIGPQKISFNSHRTFSLKYLLEIFTQNFNVIKFSYIDDKGLLFEGVSLTQNLIQKNCGCNYGCGIFHLRKKN